MKILDLVESIITETDETLLQKLLDRFRKTTGEFNNASHKFYSVRKALGNELEGDEQEAIKKVSPGEFFTYLKSQKSEKKPESKQSEELRGITREELARIGDVYAVIDQWVTKFYPKYSVDEITDALYDSALGDFEERPYIRKEVRSSIIKKDAMASNQKESEIRPTMEKKFSISKQEAKNQKGTEEYLNVVKDVKQMIVNQPRMPGEKPQKPFKIYGYAQNTLKSKYDAVALKSFKEGDQERAKKFVIMRDIIKNMTFREFDEWFLKNQ